MLSSTHFNNLNCLAYKVINISRRYCKKILLQIMYLIKKLRKNLTILKQEQEQEHYCIYTIEPAAKPSLGSWEHKTSGYFTGFGCVSTKHETVTMLFRFLSPLASLKSFKTHSNFLRWNCWPVHVYMCIHYANYGSLICAQFCMWKCNSLVVYSILSVTCHLDMHVFAGFKIDSSFWCNIGTSFVVDMWKHVQLNDKIDYEFVWW